MDLRFLSAWLLALSTLVLTASAPAADYVKPDPTQPKIAEASDEGRQAISGFKVPQGLRMELFAAEPLLANPVAFYVDGTGKVWVCETFRQSQGVEDNRGHMYWLDDDLAAQTVADRLAFFKKHLGEKVMEYTRHDDRIRVLTDENGDGKADKSTVFADGFNDIVEGTGAGVLVRREDVFYTNIPNLWRLRDTNGDLKADERDSLHYGYGVRVAFRGHDMHGLCFGPDGKLYYSIGDRGFNVTTDDGRTLANPTTGAVFRCNPDGSELEVFATGLRNPQELAFDEYGNLFTGDNNSDSGDEARWVHVVEGGDSGWRMSYQYFNDRGPWNREKLWHPYHEGQAAYIVPPVQNLGDGPSGLTYYPGTGLGDEYQGTFFLCDFRGGAANSGIHAIKLKPDGATFSVASSEQFVWQILCTDAAFGPDGAFYISDWVDGWNGPGKGRIYRVVDPQRQQQESVRQVASLLGGAIYDLPVKELTKLLRHADMRVRQEAQFTLAAHGPDVVPELSEIAASSDHQLARIHAIWTIGQIARKRHELLDPVIALTADEDSEIRAQAARVLGDARVQSAKDELITLLSDDSPRCRYFAAMGLGKLGQPDTVEPLVEMLRNNADEDPVLRHAGVMGLAGAANEQQLLALAKDASPAVRVAALLALRRAESPQVATFLADADPRLILEAARAINDVPINAAMPALASLIEKPTPSDPELADALLRRVLNANFRLGETSHAAALASFAGRENVPAAMRVEALDMLGGWEVPSGRDRVMGLWRPLDKREKSVAAAALRAELGPIFSGPDEVRQKAAEVAAKLGIQEVVPALLQLVADSKQSATARVEALKAIRSLKDSRLTQAMQAALDSSEPRLRAEGRRVLAELKPAESIASLMSAIESKELVERQAAIDVLGTVDDRRAAELLGELVDQLVNGDLPAEVHLDVLQAAAEREDKDLLAKLQRLQTARSPDDPLAGYRPALAGGDADAGRRIFFERAEVSCVRCHKVGGVGGEVGPDLSRIGGQQNREYLLESIVHPNKAIAKGFESAVVLLDDGKQYTGVLKNETEDELQLVTADGHLMTIDKEAIDVRATGKSPMPEDVVKYLSKSDLRDLVEFLASQK